MRYVGVGIAAVLVLWLFPSDGGDQILDWLTARAILDGHDPHASTRELATLYGMPGFGNAAPHPRLPGALLLSLPLALVPLDWVPTFGKVLVVGALAATVLLARPSMFAYPIVAFPAANAVFYANSSAVVTLLVATGSGVALGAATTMRLWPGFIVLGFVLLRRWRTVGAAAATFVGLNLAGLLLPGVTIGGTWDTLTVTRQFIETEGKATFGVPLWAGIAVAVLSLIAVWRSQDAKWSIIGALALSPVVWLHYLTVLLVLGGKSGAMNIAPYGSALPTKLHTNSPTNPR